MRPRSASLVLIVAVASVTPPATARFPVFPPAPPLGTFVPGDTIHVAPPTGKEADRASILAALERARPGDAIQFDAGTYLVGEIINVPTPGLTLLGYPDGTTLRGCDPDEFEQSERVIAAAATADAAMIRAAWVRCGLLELTGGNVTVRNLTFELSRLGLLLGCCHLERRFGESEGGYVVEGNTFRNSHNGIRPWTTEPSTIRGNRFVNTFHAISGAEVFLEGDRNRVTLRSAADSVLDLGTGNEVSVANGAERSDVAPGERVAGEADTVHVAPPTSETETDRASILAAFDAVEPGGTILFAPGTYLVGEIIHVTVPGITVLGHSEGTMLRGCDPAIFPRGVGLEEMFVAVVGCNGLDMAGGHQTVRGLTFEYAWHALVLGGMECMEGRGCVPVLEPVDTRGGGYLVEGNTFRASANGVRAIGQWRDPAVIRDNDFVDTFHAVVVHGSTVHVLDNDISAPDPARVPTWGYPGGALLLSSTELNGELSLRCAGNIFARNRVEGHPTAVAILILRPGTVCRDNVIRDNTIRVARVRTALAARGETASTEEDAWGFGVPISLVGSPEALDLAWPPAVEEAVGASGLEGNLIEGNRVLGAEGLGVEIFRASRNRIVGNTIRDVRRRDPFPGTSVNAPDPERSGWREANGSGIWLSPGSDGNEIVGNTFEDLAGAAVFLEGDDNRVELQSADDEVRDRGRANRVTRQRGTTSTSGEVADTDSGGFDIETRRTPGGADTVHVAPPTGEQETDRASILAALEEVRPGGTVLFAPGTYLLGEFIRVSVARVTLQGHPDGTTLRGCDPADYPEYQVQSLACNGLELAAGHQTVRNLTVEHAWHGMQIGCCRDQVRESARTGEGGPSRAQPGGHLIEDNRFRSVGTAMRVIGESSDPIVVRQNVFRNVFHALVINGATVHVLDNDISSPEPELVPAGASSGGAIGIFPAPPAQECGGNVIAGNRIEGHPDGIGLAVGVPGTRCERNVVRDNTIIVRRVPIRENPFGLRIANESDSTVVGVPIRVTNMVGVDGALPIPPTWELEGETVIGGHRIEGNRVMGAEGIGIEIRRSSGNRIANNVVTGIERRDPFPGNLVNSVDPEAWDEANGSAIWVSPGSDGNEIVDNTFEDVAAYAVVAEGDGNRVELRSASDRVLDLGRRNRVSEAHPADRPTGSAGVASPDRSLPSAPTDHTSRVRTSVGDLAERVVIYRDGYGVPHIHGETDAATVFGFAYAQAEDDFWQVEDNFIRALGRAAEVYGEPLYSADLLNRALRVNELSQEEYRRLSPQLRRICDAAAAGYNHFLQSHPEVEPRLIPRFEPWHILAFIRWMRFQSDYGKHANAHGISAEDDLRGGSQPVFERKTGSNGWAVGPSRSASGHALLFNNPHLGFFGSEQFYEAHLHSDEGLRISGATFFGFPVMNTGFTPWIGFVATDALPDQVDFYVETFDHPARPLAYRYGTGYREATEWEATVMVKTDSGVETRRQIFRRTHHGPIVGTWEGKPLAVKMARLEEGGVLRQMYEKARARNLEQFKAALQYPAYNMNWVYADRDGNIFYTYTGAIPRRDDSIDWTRPVDGSDPGTEWKGWHTLADMPQVTNPSSGFLFSANHPPFEVSSTDNPDPADFPAYMRNQVFVPSQEVRAQASMEILSGDSSFTFEEWQRAAFDRKVRAASVEVPKLVSEWDELQKSEPDRAGRLRPAMDLLRSWDGVTRMDSEAATLFALWYPYAHPEQYPAFWMNLQRAWLAGWGGGTSEAGQSRLDILERVMDRLEDEWGTWRVPHGEMVRIQRVRDPGGFSDEVESVGVPGGDPNTGQIFFVAAVPGPDRKRRYGVAGHSYAGVQEYGGKVKALSVTVFGQSADPDSPHYMDQAELYSRGEFKAAWLDLEDVRKNAVRVYRPGE